MMQTTRISIPGRSGGHAIPPLPGAASLADIVFLFTDIEGSTRRWERSPEAMRDALARHDAVMRRAMAPHGGHVFKTLGDSFYVAFADAEAALAAALAASVALSLEDFGGVDGLDVRMAIHVGAAESRDDDYFGPTLNRAARLMSIAHGGQILVSAAISVRLPPGSGDRYALRDLGWHRLKDLDQEEHVFQVVAPGLRSEFPPLLSLNEIPHNLPYQATSFVGRRAERNEVAALLAKHQLVTLAGPGGVGKTRLSLQIGKELLQRYPDGVWFIEFAPLSEAELVVETLADLFSVPPQANRSAVDAVTGFLRQKAMLLILDNCEHLIADVAILAEALVKRCPRVAMLASSREPLRVPGEHLFRMPMLAAPGKDAVITAAEALTYPAVELFVDRGRAATGGFQLTDSDAPAVAAICRRLDGIALAIELAAARLKMLKPAQLLDRLEDRFRLLTGGARTHTSRQQTLRALIDWSHDLLSEPEAILMRRLSAFAEGWTLEAAVAVASDDPTAEWEALDLLQSLVDKSLVVADSIGDETRYRFLENTRYYAAEKLTQAGEGSWPERVAAYLVTLMERAEQDWQTLATTTWLTTYGPEIDNVRGALDWSLGPGGQLEIGLALVAHAGRLWNELSHVVELRRRMQGVSTRLDENTPPGVAARILLWSSRTEGTGMLSVRDARRLAVEHARRAEEPWLLGYALAQHAVSLIVPETMSEAIARLEEARTIVEPLGHSKLLSSILNCLGIVQDRMGDFVAARSLYDRSAAVAREVGDSRNLSLVLANIGVSWGEAGDLKAAIAAAREAKRSAAAAGDRETVMLINAHLAGCLVLEGEMDEAARLAANSLERARDLEDRLWAADAMLPLACAAAAAQPDIAAKLQGFADGVRTSEEITYGKVDRSLTDRTLETLAATLAPAVLASLMAEGAAMSLAGAAELGLSISRIAAA